MQKKENKNGFVNVYSSIAFSCCCPLFAKSTVLTVEQSTVFVQGNLCEVKTSGTLASVHLI